MRRAAVGVLGVLCMTGVWAEDLEAGRLRLICGV